ncbi:hypothetical protein D917_08153, partial [Trichinella nativa]
WPEQPLLTNAVDQGCWSKDLKVDYRWPLLEPRMHPREGCVPVQLLNPSGDRGMPNPIRQCPRGIPWHFREQMDDTDASETGIGALLSQKHEPEGERVIAYASRALSKTERKQLLSIVYLTQLF